MNLLYVMLALHTMIGLIDWDEIIIIIPDNN